MTTVATGRQVTEALHAGFDCRAARDLHLHTGAFHHKQKAVLWDPLRAMAPSFIANTKRTAIGCFVAGTLVHTKM